MLRFTFHSWRATAAANHVARKQEEEQEKDKSLHTFASMIAHGMLCVSALKRGRGCGEVHTRCAWRAGGVWLARSLLDAAHVVGVGWVRGCRVWRRLLMSVV
jgi:hypothetical protein